MSANAAANAAARTVVRRKVLKQMAGGLVVCTLPVFAWWKWSSDERRRLAEDVRTRIRLPGGMQTTDDLLIEQKIQPGDVLLFDRRCEKCAAGPWAALACLAGRSLLCDDSRLSSRSVDSGKFDHIGLVVPGYVKARGDEYDPTNLLLMEATPSGIVARPLTTRLEMTQSRSVVLLQLASPGEKRNNNNSTTTDDDEQQQQLATAPAVLRTRQHVEKELKQFRDRWTELGKEKGYGRFHSTVALGGAAAHGLGLQDYVSGPVSPSAYLVLLGLQRASAAQNVSERENLQTKAEDFLRDYRFEERDAVRLRPGWRFLAPIPVRETSRS